MTNIIEAVESGEVTMGRIVSAEQCVDADKIVKMSVEVNNRNWDIFCCHHPVYSIDQLPDKLVGVVMKDKDPLHTRFGTCYGIAVFSFDKETKDKHIWKPKED